MVKAVKNPGLRPVTWAAEHWEVRVPGHDGREDPTSAYPRRTVRRCCAPSAALTVPRLLASADVRESTPAEWRSA